MKPTLIPRVLLLTGRTFTSREYSQMERTLPVDLYFAERTGEVFEQLLLRNYPVIVIADGVGGVSIEQLCATLRFCRSDMIILVLGKIPEETRERFHEQFSDIRCLGGEISADELCNKISDSLPGIRLGRKRRVFTAAGA